MYWPTSTARIIKIPNELKQEDIIKVVPSRKGNFFLTLTPDGLGIWDVRVSLSIGGDEDASDQLIAHSLTDVATSLGGKCGEMGPKYRCVLGDRWARLDNPGASKRW